MSVGLLLLLGLAQEPAPAAPGAEVLVAEVLRRAVEPNAERFSAAEAELVAHPEAFDVLLEALGTARAPDEDGATLGARQLDLVLSALEKIGPSRLSAFVTNVAHEAEIGPRSVAAVRILGARTRAEDFLTLLGLARTAESAGRFELLEVPWSEALLGILQRAPKCALRLRERWNTLGPAVGSTAVQALERLETEAALDVLRSLLGLSRGLEACLLVALGNRGSQAEAKTRDEVALELEPYLSRNSTAETLAAAQALGRLASPSAVPGLLEVLTHSDAACARAVLGSLRSIGGVNLPGSEQVWRSWYAREEAWWEGRARDAFVSLGAALESQNPGAAFECLREISEHPLHRDELAKRLVRLLERPEPTTRVLVSECLARLGSREGVAALRALVDDPEGEVAAAARAALTALEGRSERSSRRGKNAS